MCRSRPEITVVSAQPIPLPTSPEASAPLPAPSSPSTQSPRAPARRAPTRPPPSRKMAPPPPPAKDSSPPLPSPREATEGDSKAPPSPVAPPRRSKADGGAVGQTRKPPLRKAHTLPPQPRGSPPPPQTSSHKQGQTSQINEITSNQIVSTITSKPCYMYDHTWNKLFPRENFNESLQLVGYWCSYN